MGQNPFFCHFLKFASLVFLDMAQDCRLEQCLTSRRVKTSKIKKMWPKLGSNRPRSGLN